MAPNMQVSSWDQASPSPNQRSPRRTILKNHTALTPSKSSKHQKQTLLLNEVRESLSMPCYSTNYDDDTSEVFDDDDVTSRENRRSHVDSIISKGQRHHSTPVHIPQASQKAKVHEKVEQARPPTSHPEQAYNKYTGRTNKQKSKDYNDDVSVGAASTKSTKSTRSIRSFFRRKKPEQTAVAPDDVSVAASTKSGWFKKRTALIATPAVPKIDKKSASNDPNTKGEKTIQTFRVVKPKKTHVRGAGVNHDQLVADFFDVKSLASEPDFVGSRKLQKTNIPSRKDAAQQRGKSSRQLEVSSVVSGGSQRSNVFARFFQQMRRINDEVCDLDDENDHDAPDFTGTGIILGNDEDSSILDDELTMCSDFDNLSRMGSLKDDEYDNASRGSNDSAESNQVRSWNNRTTNSFDSPSPSVDENQKKTEQPFIHKIMERRRLKNESTILLDVVGLTTGQTSNTSNSDSGVQRVESPITKREVHGSNELLQTPKQNSPLNRSKKLTAPYSQSPTNIQRTRALEQAGMKLLTSKSMSNLPSSIERSPEDGSSPLVTPKRGLSRWNSDVSLNSDTSGPKRPSRGGGGGRVSPEKNVTATPSPSARLSPKKSVDKMMKTSQSMRNLCSPKQPKVDEDDDDDSILSLLSGLLATWSEERDGFNLTVTQHLPPLPSGGRLKSILKSSLSDASEEEKIESRDRGRFTVSFKTIEIREYERIVGDNPSCSKGPPISIGWEYKLCRFYPINDYERMIRGPRRSKKEFHLTADLRTHILVNEWNCSEDDIRKARREATYIQYCRAKTAFSGSRAAAKEAAFLRKASDRSKKIPMPQQPIPQRPIFQEKQKEINPNLPNQPARRPTMDQKPTSTSNRNISSPPTPAISQSVRHNTKAFLEM